MRLYDIYGSRHEDMGYLVAGSLAVSILAAGICLRAFSLHN